jgi:ribosomal protein L37E
MVMNERERREDMAKVAIRKRRCGSHKPSTDTVLCSAEGSGVPIIIREARENYHYNGGVVKGEAPVSLKTENTNICGSCGYRCMD